jgi:threonyl-tRNA synthetase
MGKKIREAEMQKIPFMIIVGEQEEKDGTISVRRHGGEDLGSMTMDAFAKVINEEVASTMKTFEV